VRVDILHEKWVAAEEEARVAKQKVGHLMDMLEDMDPPLDDVYDCYVCGVSDYLAKGHINKKNDEFYCRWCADNPPASSESEDSSSSQ